MFPLASCHRPASLALALALAVPLAPPTAHAQAPAYPTDPDRDPPPLGSPLAVEREYPAELVLPPVAALLQAERLARSGQHLEAALLLESQWAATGDLRIGYHAARARARAGHHALALRHYQRLLEPGSTLSAIARDHVTAQIASERAQARTVRLRLVEAVPGSVVDLPAEALAGARITLEIARGVDLPPEPLGPGTPLALDVGVWAFRLEVPGYLPLAGQLTIDGTTEPPLQTLELVRRPVDVLLRFSPARAGRGTLLRLTATDRYPPPILEHQVKGPTHQVTMTAGAWEITASHGRYSANQRVTILPQQGPIDVALIKSADPPRFTRDKKLMFGVMGGFITSYLVGLGLILGGSARDTRIEDRNNALLEAEGLDPKKNARPDPAALARIEAAYPTREYHRDLLGVSNLTTSGVHVAIAGVGAALSVLPVALGARKRVAYIELGVGAALLGGGATWLTAFLNRRAGLLAPDARRVTNSEFDDLSGAQLGASMLTGAGIGIVTFSTVGLIVDAARRRKAERRRFTLEPGPGPGHVGAGLRARF